MRIIVPLLLLLTTVAAIQCGKGGLLCNQNQCHYPSYIEGCFTYSSNNLCTQCEYNYKISNGRCFYNPKSDGSDCCLKFGIDGKCIQCAAGLQLNSVSGLCQDQKIQGCIKKNEVGCQICASDYDLVSGICVPAVDKCVKYDANLNCISCDSSTVLFQGSCVPLISVKNISNCYAYIDFGCGQCESGYSLTPQGTCQLSIAGCMKLGTDSRCQICQSPFFELNNGSCLIVGCSNYSNGACQCCDQSLGFKLRNGRCEIDSCTYFSRRGCITCAGGLVAGPWGCRRPEGKVCQICKIDEYLGSDGQCRKKDVHCVQYKNGVCFKCCEDFFMDSTFLCKPIQPGCVYTNGQCTSCSSPFIFVNGNCVVDGCIKYCKDGCLQCDSRLTLFGKVCGLPNCEVISNFKCQKCLAGYSSDQSGNCIANDPNCLMRNSMNICVKCKDGYQLGQDGRCSSLKLGCNYVDGRCTSCRAPFIYVPATESCEIDGCAQYFVGGCEKCVSGYALLYNTCKLPNCLISKNGKCLECDPDYVFKSDGTCVSKDEFCEKMDEYGTCIKCMSSYYYSQKLHKCVKKSPGCEYDLDDNCCKCNAPFTYEPGRCVIKGCLSVDEKGCYECMYPYSLTKAKTCVIAHCLSYDQNGHCSSCEAGFALSSQFTCLIQDQYCSQYNSARSQCLKCVKGYHVDGNGRCQYSDQHCSYFDQSGICINCDRLYFLNPFGKCQLRDPQCEIYTNGMCSLCKAYYFPKGGYCMANMPGCKVQKAYGNCVSCEEGYQLKKGDCVAVITKLTWNSVDMDFFGDGNDCDKEKSKSVFTVGVNSKLNLAPVISRNQGSIFYSSLGLNNASVLLSAQGSSGWSPSGSCVGQYVGFKSSGFQTFYACDIKQLTGSALKSFMLQYSMDGQNFLKIDEFSFSSIIIGAVSTFYFKPVYAQFIRLVVKQGTPNIRFEFYTNSGENSTDSSQDDTFIGQTVAATINGAEQGGISECKFNDSLCWAGIESCEPRKIQGFSLVYDQSCGDRVSEVKIEYSTDGLTFSCYKDCKSLSLSGGDFTFSPALLAQKIHVHFSKYVGHPKFGIKFVYV